MRTLRITLAYDGTDFRGWQIQPVGRTVQGEIEEAFRGITGEPARVVGASRTDSGVHALAMVASVVTGATIPCERLRAGLDALTGNDVVPFEVREAPEGFHARHSSRGKRYEYRIRNAPCASPFERRYSWHLRAPLRIDDMRAAAAHLIGTHDFSSFRAAGCGAASPVREMRRIEVSAEGCDVRVVMDASAFLQGMARIVVGTLADVGMGRARPEGVAAVLAARDRSAAGRTAPPHGLFLESVFYP